MIRSEENENDAIYISWNLVTYKLKLLVTAENIENTKYMELGAVGQDLITD